MLQVRLRALRAHFGAVLRTGDPDHDFRARVIFAIAGINFATTVFLAIVGYAQGNVLATTVIGLIAVSIVVALWYLFTRRNLGVAAAILLSALMAGTCLSLILSGGGLIGTYVILPTIVWLGAVLCSRAVAIVGLCVASAVVLLVCLAPTEPLQLFAVGERDQAWVLARVTILTSISMLLSMLAYRAAAQKIRDRVIETREQLKVTNSEMASVLTAQLASTELILKFHEIGDLVGWWYEPAEGKVHYTATETGELLFFELAVEGSHAEIEANKTLGINLRRFVTERVVAEVSWDEEAQISNSDGSVRWYRDAGEVAKVDSQVVRITGVLQDITATKALTDQLEVHASYDELTGLYNRRIFWQAVALEHQSPSAATLMSHLLFIDLDQFKLVNDTSGHAAGDELLKIVAKTLCRNLHSSDVVGRVGGDEFGVILRNCERTKVGAIAERLRGEIEKIFFNWKDETFRVGASIGVITINPEQGTAEELQQLVDAACYEAKLAGRNRVNFFEGGEEIIAAHRGEARWVQRLHDAMQHDRFELHGQIIRSAISSDEPERYEVLIRLRDTDSDRLIPPGAFLPAAERFGLSPQIDQWVLDHLLKKLSSSPDAEKLNRKYWVNLSGNSIGDKRFRQYLVDTMRSSKLPKGLINFEITETAVIRNIDDAGEFIGKLRAMGCQFALDDFGSGLSSFGYLKSLPVDILKIDGMFVKEILNDEADRVFVRAIISIAQAVGLKTVAEFVENDEIFQLVKEFGVDYVQGYGIHRPERLWLPDEQAEKTISSAGNG